MKVSQLLLKVQIEVDLSKVSLSFMIRDFIIETSTSLARNLPICHPSSIS